MMNQNPNLETVSDDTSCLVKKGAHTLLSDINIAEILNEHDLNPAFGWRHLILNLVTEKGVERIDSGARWIYAERLLGSVASAENQELLLVAFGSYRALQDNRIEPRIDSCAVLDGTTVELMKAVSFLKGDLSQPVVVKKHELASKLRHARSLIGNPVTYRKANKPNKEAAA